MSHNKKVAQSLNEIADLLEIRGTPFKPAAYRKAAKALENLKEDIADIYKKQGIKGVKEIPGVGESISKKIVEYLKKNRIKYLIRLEKDTAIQQIVTHYFETKGVPLAKLKESAKKRRIIYSRFTRPAKELLIYRDEADATLGSFEVRNTIGDIKLISVVLTVVKSSGAIALDQPLTAVDGKTGEALGSIDPLVHNSMINLS